MSRTSGNMSDISALALKNMMNPSGELVVSTTSETVNKHALPLSLSALFKHRKVSKKTRWNDSIETNTVSETKSVTFSHPYLDYPLKLTYRFGSLCQPSYALTVPHIIDLRSPDWKSVGFALDSALWGGDVGEIQQLMSTHQITPRTRLSGMWVGGQDGGTLFEVSHPKEVSAFDRLNGTHTRSACHGVFARESLPVPRSAGSVGHHARRGRVESLTPPWLGLPGDTWLTRSIQS